MHNFKGSNVQARDRRRYNRHDFQQEISYIFGRSDAEEICTGITVNMSCSGMCLHVSNPLSLGQEITIKRENQYYVKGTVIWCNELSEKLHPYKIGLQFV
jgi:hypothetical protein